MPLTIEQAQAELTTRLPTIEKRVEWVITRELAGSGQGLTDRVMQLLRTDLAALRTALELPAAELPTALYPRDVAGLPGEYRDVTGFEHRDTHN